MLTTRTHEPPKAQHSYQVLATLLTLGRGPHAVQTVADHCGLSNQAVRQELNAMVDAELCTRATTMPGHYELTTPVVGTDSSWLMHALPTVEAYTHDELRALHQNTGHVVLLHSHTLLPPVRLCLDHYKGDRTDFTQQLTAHPDAAARLRQAPLGTDAPGMVIKAHLGTARPTSAALQRIRTAGYATSAAPLPGWTLLSVPIRSTPSALGLWELGTAGVAGAVSLALPTPDPGPHLTALLNELQRTALELEPLPDGIASPRRRYPAVRTAA
ncbi:hypothetical protein ACFY0Z_30955 [Streptomyces kronopolitis]|uniref:hypothetical protein n=1 Tax=Streptomyces kronopolitis TaxID=1612435 RepID=UPI0036D1B106